MDLAGIPLKREDRELDDPFIMVGGSCAYNCEPLADFIDIAILGEGEEVNLEVVAEYKEWKKNKTTREDFLARVAKIERGLRSKFLRCRIQRRPNSKIC